MGLFSKRNASDSTETESETEAVATSDDASSNASSEESVPQVSISVSAVGASPFIPGAVGAAAAAPASEPEAPAEPAEPEAPAAGPETNLDLGEALLGLPGEEGGRAMLHVLRQALQGKLLLSTNLDGVSAEDQAAGRIPLGVHRDEDGDIYLLAYTSGVALERMRSGDEPLHGISVPSLWALGQARTDDYAGIILDPSAGDASAVIPKELINRMFGDGRNNDAAKQALAQPREAGAEQRIVEALAERGGFVAGRADVDENGVRTSVGVAETRMGDRRMLEVFTSPLEIAALGRGDDAYPVTAAELAGALRSDEGISGIIVNPAAPWIDLDREQLTLLLSVE